MRFLLKQDPAELAVPANQPVCRLDTFWISAQLCVASSQVTVQLVSIWVDCCWATLQCLLVVLYCLWVALLLERCVAEILLLCADVHVDVLVLFLLLWGVSSRVRREQ